MSGSCRHLHRNNLTELSIKTFIYPFVRFQSQLLKFCPSTILIKMVVPPRKPGTYSSFRQLSLDDETNVPQKPSKMASDLANLQEQSAITPIIGDTKLRKPKNICVVGAGVAGLRCAELLIANGMNVTIIEARDRVGGRVCYLYHLYFYDCLLSIAHSNETEWAYH